MHAIAYSGMTYRVRVSDRICTCEQELSLVSHIVGKIVALRLK